MKKDSLPFYEAPPSDSIEPLYQRGTQHQLDYQYDMAIPLLNAVLQADPKHFKGLAQLAFCLRMTGKFRPAITAFRKALRISPNHPELLEGMANCYKDMGDFDKAIAAYERALKLKPGMADSLYGLVLLQEYSLNAPLVRELHRLHRSLSDTDESRIPVCFALGVVYEHHKELSRAFEYYQEGNRLKFVRSTYHESAQFAYFDAVQTCFTADVFSRRKEVGSHDVTPIFVVGMPRSGSTLVEQILASHSHVDGAGETNILPRMAERLTPQTGGVFYPEAINNLSTEARAQLAQHFLRQLRERCPDNKPRIATKTLSNFFHIGLIHLLLPRATIIHCVRDPMDTCWSAFRLCFTGNDLLYCYNQDALGRYYCRYQQLMRHWHQVLPGRIYDLRYEQLVTQPEATMRSLLEHCNLPWEKNCLSFYRTPRPVTTASMRQVRRPIYTTSIRSWEAVAEKLAPLRTALQPDQTIR
jgi:tetratricopeptide (TPR) repeat protein